MVQEGQSLQRDKHSVSLHLWAGSTPAAGEQVWVWAPATQPAPSRCACLWGFVLRIGFRTSALMSALLALLRLVPSGRRMAPGCLWSQPLCEPCE